MITNNDEQVNKDILVEIEKNRKILDKVYADTENLKRDKSTYESDILRITKHITYLTEESSKKDHEILLKTNAISGLDNQISDKSKRCNVLESEINSLESSISKKNVELSEMEEKISEHKVFITNSTNEIQGKHKVADEKMSKVEYNISKIEALLQELK